MSNAFTPNRSLSYARDVHLACNVKTYWLLLDGVRRWQPLRRAWPFPSGETCRPHGSKSHIATRSIGMPRLCVLAIGPKFPFSEIRMFKMNRNNVGPFRWDGRSSLRDAAPCQPGNRQLRPDDGNRRIDGNSGQLVHGEILRHLRAIGACLGFRRGRGIPILFAGVSFIRGNLQRKTTGRLEWIQVAAGVGKTSAPFHTLWRLYRTPSELISD